MCWNGNTFPFFFYKPLWCFLPHKKSPQGSHGCPPGNSFLRLWRFVGIAREKRYAGTFPFRRPGRCSPAGLPGLAALQSFAPLPFVCRFTVPSHRLAGLGWMEAAGLRSWQCASSSPSGGGTLPPSLHPCILTGTRL